TRSLTECPQPTPTPRNRPPAHRRRCRISGVRRGAKRRCLFPPLRPLLGFLAPPPTPPNLTAQRDAATSPMCWQISINTLLTQWENKLRNTQRILLVFPCNDHWAQKQPQFPLG